VEIFSGAVDICPKHLRREKSRFDIQAMLRDSDQPKNSNRQEVSNGEPVGCCQTWSSQPPTCPSICEQNMYVGVKFILNRSLNHGDRQSHVAPSQQTTGSTRPAWITKGNLMHKKNKPNKHRTTSEYLGHPSSAPTWKCRGTTHSDNGSPTMARRSSQRRPCCPEHPRSIMPQTAGLLAQAMPSHCLLHQPSPKLPSSAKQTTHGLLLVANPDPRSAMFTANIVITT
jgi:hypothetical protein